MRFKTYTLYFGGAMAMFSEGKIKRVFKFLENIKVFTLEQLVASLSCSIPTARLKLKQWQTYTSYNQNGRYYAMPAVPGIRKREIRSRILMGEWCR